MRPRLLARHQGPRQTAVLRVQTTCPLRTAHGTHVGAASFVLFREGSHDTFDISPGAGAGRCAGPGRLRQGNGGGPNAGTNAGASGCSRARRPTRGHGRYGKPRQHRWPRRSGKDWQRVHGDRGHAPGLGAELNGAGAAAGESNRQPPRAEQCQLPSSNCRMTPVVMATRM